MLPGLDLQKLQWLPGGSTEANWLGGKLTKWVNSDQWETRNERPLAHKLSVPPPPTNRLFQNAITSIPSF